MEEIKYTPGPRRAVRSNGQNGFVLGPDGQQVVGRFHCYADAVLDAAAPALLEALTELVAALPLFDRDQARDLANAKDKAKSAIHSSTSAGGE